MDGVTREVKADKMGVAIPDSGGRPANRIKLYELTNVEGKVVSVFVWRSRFALSHKGLTFESVPISYFDIPKIGTGTLKTSPILEDGGLFTSDSWAIAELLDEAYPERPALFGSPGELAAVRFFDKWFGTAVMPHFFRACVLEIFDQVAPGEQAYFRSSREATLGATFEEVAARRDDHLSAGRDALLPLRLALRHSPYIGGTAPSYADYIAWGCFVGFDAVASWPLLADNDPLLPWLRRGLAVASQFEPGSVPDPAWDDRGPR